MTASPNTIRPELFRTPIVVPLTSALVNWTIRRANADLAAAKASSAATDLYRTDIPFLLKLGRGAA
jgi:hypothetical protein